MSNSQTSSNHAQGQREQGLSHLQQGEIILSRLAFAALGAIVVLAFFAPQVPVSDRIVFLPLGLAAIGFWMPFLLRRAAAHREVSSFLLTAAMFLIYGLARSVGPDQGFELRFAALPEDIFVVPYSAYIVVFASLFTGPFWWRKANDWTRAVISSTTIIALLMLGSFSLLRQYFPTGPAEMLDPNPLPRLAMKLVEYGCVALLCHAVTARKETRRWALQLMPGVLLLLWARYQFFAAAGESGQE